MEHLECLDFGWQRDLPDHRDYAPRRGPARRLLRTLGKRPGAEATLPPQVDWREFCPPVQDQGLLAASSVHACLALVQYFERRAHGRAVFPSRLFVYQNARRLLHRAGDHGVTLRDTLKAITRFGLPPESHWPYEAGRLQSQPDAFLYQFQREVAALTYIRLDQRSLTGNDTLERARAFLAAGFPLVLGFTLYSSVGTEAEILYPTMFDSVHSGHAVMAVGYDDGLRLRSEKGALLVRNSWGAGWGERGYGWLPYAYVRQKLAVDLWTLLKPDWLASGEFTRPRV